MLLQKIIKEARDKTSSKTWIVYTDAEDIDKTFAGNTPIFAQNNAPKSDEPTLPCLEFEGIKCVFLPAESDKFIVVEDEFGGKVIYEQDKP